VGKAFLGKTAFFHGRNPDWLARGRFNKTPSTKEKIDLLVIILEVSVWITK
jgi:hypothetical protein